MHACMHTYIHTWLRLYKLGCLNTEGAKYNYKTKTIKVEYKREPISNEAINDTTIISFKNNGNNIYTEIAYSGGYPFSISGDIRSVPS